MEYIVHLLYVKKPRLTLIIRGARSYEDAVFNALKNRPLTPKPIGAHCTVKTHIAEYHYWCRFKGPWQCVMPTTLWPVVETELKQFDN
jgi:hypothetical protein